MKYYVFLYFYSYSYLIQMSQYIIHTFCNIFNTYIFILEKKYFIQLYCCFIILGFLTIFFNRRKHYRSASHKLFRKRLACQHNIRLTCICAFAVAQSGGKVGTKVALKRELRQQRPLKQLS